MIIDLNVDERAEMARRSHDVFDLMGILKDAGREDVTPESAFKAWSDHSESMSAGWLIVSRDPEGLREVGLAHDRLVDGWKEAMHDYVVGAARTHDQVVGAARGTEPSAASEPAPVAARPSPSHPRNLAAVAQLRAIGFDPAADVPRGDDRLLRMEHIAGRLANVAYMAHAIDAMDGIAPADRALAVSGGQRQLDHMMKGDRKGLEEGGRCYVALRRAQREGDDAKVRTGLVLLVAADNGEIGYGDVLTAMGDDGRPRQAAIGVERRQLGATGAKGPSSGAEAAPLMIGRDGAVR